MTAWKLLLAVLALAATLALPQAASAQAPPDERAAAREFSYAAYRLKVRIKEQTPAIERGVRVAFSDRCFKFVAGAPGPRTDDAFAVTAELMYGALIGPIAPALRTFAAELERVPTADPALRSGRAAWRELVAVLATIQPVPLDACEQLRRWAAAGYLRKRMPRFQPEAMRQLAASQDREDLNEAKMRRVAARMVELGVTTGQARRFEGETLFDGLGLDDVLGP